MFTGREHRGHELANENWGRVHDIVPILRRKCHRRAFAPFAWSGYPATVAARIRREGDEGGKSIIVALTIETIVEALLYGAKAGAGPAKVGQALMGGFESSRILEVHGERLVKHTFDPGFRLELHQRI
jgi:NAD-binding of NADP-dependent 3-hydroxyisobutyrate dehydrogenase